MIFCLTVVIPTWSRLASGRMKMSIIQVNLVGSKAALLILAFGAVLIASSSTIGMLVPGEQATSTDQHSCLANPRKRSPSMLLAQSYPLFCMQWPSHLR